MVLFEWGIWLTILLLCSLVPLAAMLWIEAPEHANLQYVSAIILGATIWYFLSKIEPFKSAGNKRDE
jgi:hypothetical protein